MQNQYDRTSDASKNTCTLLVAFHLLYLASFVVNMSGLGLKNPSSQQHELNDNLIG